MRRVCWILAALAGLKGGLADLTMSMPNSVPACSPSLLQWSGGTGPYAVTLRAPATFSTAFSFYNISSSPFNAPVVYPPSTLLEAVIMDSQGSLSAPVTLNVTSGTEKSCFPFFQATNTEQESPTGNLTWIAPSVGESLSICDTTTTFSWSGGIPPYRATIMSLNEKVMERQIYDNLTTTSFKAMIQLSPNIVAQASVIDGLGNTAQSDPFILNNGTSNKCLLSNFGIISNLHNVSLMINSTPAKTNVDIRLIAILLTIGILLAVIPAAFLIITRLRSRHKFKLPDLLEDPPNHHPDTMKVEPYRVMPLCPAPNELKPTPFMMPPTAEIPYPNLPQQAELKPPQVLVQPNGKASEKARLQIANQRTETLSVTTMNPGDEDQLTSARRAVYHTDGGVVEEVDEFPPAYRYSKASTS